MNAAQQVESLIKARIKELGIVAHVQACMLSDYENYRVEVIVKGAKLKTLDMLHDEFKQYAMFHYDRATQSHIDNVRSDIPQVRNIHISKDLTVAMYKRIEAIYKAHPELPQYVEGNFKSMKFWKKYLVQA